MRKIKLLFSYLLGHKRQVAAAVLKKGGKVLIAKRKKFSTLGGKWEFPGGKIEPGETPESCLRRELKEEFDIDTRIGKFICSTKFTHYLVPIELLAYEAEYQAGEIKLKDHDDAKWVTPAEMYNYDFLPADKPIVNILGK